jgi:hypothetical protein
MDMPELKKKVEDYRAVLKGKSGQACVFSENGPANMRLIDAIVASLEKQGQRIAALERIGAAVGRTLGLKKRETYRYIFLQNAKSPRNQRWTDQEISDFMKKEFPKSISKLMEPAGMNVHRKFYNARRARNEPEAVQY